MSARRVALIALALSGCFAPVDALLRANKASQGGDFRRAETLCDRVAIHPGVGVAEKARARLEGGHAALRLGDRAGAESRFDAAVQLDVAGISDGAMYELAELIVPRDRARAQQLYYRAAAAAERRGRVYPYREAMARLVEMSILNP